MLSVCVGGGRALSRNLHNTVGLTLDTMAHAKEISLSCGCARLYNYNSSVTQLHNQHIEMNYIILAAKI